MAQHLQHWLCSISMSLTWASAKRQQYLCALADGALQFAPSWPGQGPWSCAVKEVHLGSWSDSFWSEKSLPRWDATLEIIKYAEPKHEAKSNKNNSGILCCAASKQYILDWISTATMQRRVDLLYEKLEPLSRISLFLSNTLYDSITLLLSESLTYAMTCSTFRTVNNCFSLLMLTTSLWR